MLPLIKGHFKICEILLEFGFKKFHGKPLYPPEDYQYFQQLDYSPNVCYVQENCLPLFIANVNCITLLPVLRAAYDVERYDLSNIKAQSEKILINFGLIGTYLSEIFLDPSVVKIILHFQALLYSEKQILNLMKFIANADFEEYFDSLIHMPHVPHVRSKPELYKFD